MMMSSHTLHMHTRHLYGASQSALSTSTLHSSVSTAIILYG